MNDSDNVAARAAYDAVVEELVRYGATAGAMFGMPNIKADRKAFAGYFQGAMVFKLRGDKHAEALSVPGAKLFEPMAGRPMRKWVQVPASAVGRWPELARAALGTIRGAA